MVLFNATKWPKAGWRKDTSARLLILYLSLSLSLSIYIYTFTYIYIYSTIYGLPQTVVAALRPLRACSVIVGDFAGYAASAAVFGQRGCTAAEAGEGEAGRGREAQRGRGAASGGDGGKEARERRRRGRRRWRERGGKGDGGGRERGRGRCSRCAYPNSTRNALSNTQYPRGWSIVPTKRRLID